LTGSTGPPPVSQGLSARVTELGRYFRERVLELAAQIVDHRDDRDRDARRDQPVLDRRGSALVSQETREGVHRSLPFDMRVPTTVGGEVVTLRKRQGLSFCRNGCEISILQQCNGTRVIECTKSRA